MDLPKLLSTFATVATSGDSALASSDRVEFFSKFLSQESVDRPILNAPYSLEVSEVAGLSVEKKSVIFQRTQHTSGTITEPQMKGDATPPAELLNGLLNTIPKPTNHAEIEVRLPTEGKLPSIGVPDGRDVNSFSSNAAVENDSNAREKASVPTSVKLEPSVVAEQIFQGRATEADGLNQAKKHGSSELIGTVSATSNFIVAGMESRYTTQKQKIFLEQNSNGFVGIEARKTSNTASALEPHEPRQAPSSNSWQPKKLTKSDVQGSLPPFGKDSSPQLKQPDHMDERFNSSAKTPAAKYVPFQTEPVVGGAKTKGARITEVLQVSDVLSSLNRQNLEMIPESAVVRDAENLSVGVRTGLIGPNAPSRHPALAQQVAHHMQAELGAGKTGDIEIRLDPEELGKLRVNVAVRDTGLVISFVAERQDTIDLLRRNATDLLEGLADTEFARASLDFSQGETFADRKIEEAEFVDVDDDSPEQMTQSTNVVRLLDNDRLDIRL